MRKKTAIVGIILILSVTIAPTMSAWCLTSHPSTIQSNINNRPKTTYKSGGSSGPWPMYRQNPQHTGLSPYDTSETDGHLKWRYMANRHPIIHSSPAIGTDGTIYFGSHWHDFDRDDPPGFYALNDEGKLKWKFEAPTNDWGTGYSFESSPAIGTDGTIYAGCDNDYLYAFHPNGTKKWQFHMGDTAATVSCTPTIGPDGTIYVCSDHVYALRPDGTVKWKRQITNGEFEDTSPAISFDGTLYVPSSYWTNSEGQIARLLALDSATGMEKWVFDSPGKRGFNTPAIGHDGTIYTTSGFGSGGEGSGKPALFAISKDGELKWTHEFHAAVEASPGIGPDGTIYIPARKETAGLYAFTPSGELKWVFDIGEDVGMYSSPSIGADGTIFFGANDLYLYAVNPDGSLRWRYYCYGHVQTSPAIGTDGSVYVGSNHGCSIFAIAGSDGVKNKQKQSANTFLRLLNKLLPSLNIEDLWRITY